MITITILEFFMIFIFLVLLIVFIFSKDIYERKKFEKQVKKEIEILKKVINN